MIEAATDRRCAMATMLTPELSEEALESFRTTLGHEAVLTDEDERGVSRPVRLLDLGGLHGVGRADAHDGRGDPGHRASPTSTRCALTHGAG
jgi:hypothetical protein